MPPFTVLAGWVAGVLSLVAFVPYIVAILRGETRPNRGHLVDLDDDRRRPPRQLLLLRRRNDDLGGGEFTSSLPW